MLVRQILNLTDECPTTQAGAEQIGHYYLSLTEEERFERHFNGITVEYNDLTGTVQRVDVEESLADTTAAMHQEGRRLDDPRMDLGERILRWFGWTP